MSATQANKVKRHCGTAAARKEGPGKARQGQHDVTGRFPFTCQWCRFRKQPWRRGLQSSRVFGMVLWPQAPVPKQQWLFLAQQLVSFLNDGRFNDVLGLMRDDVVALGCRGLSPFRLYFLRYWVRHMLSLSIDLSRASSGGGKKTTLRPEGTGNCGVVGVA